MVEAYLFKLAPDEHQLLLNIHHIVSDGWTTSIILKEIVELYDAFRSGRTMALPEALPQYTDIALWQSNLWQGEALRREQAFWQQCFKGELPVLRLPSGWPFTPALTFSGARLSHGLPADLIEALEALGRKNNASLFMVMLAAFNVLLAALYRAN